MMLEHQALGWPLPRQASHTTLKLSKSDHLLLIHISLRPFCLTSTMSLPKFVWYWFDREMSPILENIVLAVMKKLEEVRAVILLE